MKTTADFLDDLQKKLDVKSDYAVGKLLGIHRQQLSHYRLLKGAFDDEMCLRVAEVLEIDGAYVMACMHHQRAKNPEVKAAWKHTAEMLYGLAASFLVIAVSLTLTYGVSGSDHSPALLGLTSADSWALYIMSNPLPIPPAILAPLALLAFARCLRHNPRPKNYGKPF